MQISIALATYNGAEYLQEQLDSFHGQTRLPDELVACDDGSSDSTLDILERFRRQAPFPVRICRNLTRLGFTGNFEKAINKCSGDLIFLSDQDDIWFEHKIEFLAKKFIENPDKQLLIHDGELVDENLASHGASKLSQILSGYGSADYLVTGALTVFRRSFLNTAFPIPESISGHDAWLNNIARLLDTRLVVEQSLQLIRRHNANTSSWVASSAKKINRLDVFKSQARKKAANSYEDRLLINHASRTVLENALKNNTEFSAKIIEKNLLYLASENTALENRQDLLNKNSLIRKWLALRLLTYGDYRYFNGYKSFLRDIIR